MKISLVVITLLLFAVTQVSAQLSVGTNVPLYWRVNPVYVEDGNALVVQGICDLYEGELAAVSSEGWELWVAANDYPNRISESSSVSSAVIHPDYVVDPDVDPTTRISYFEIEYNSSLDWCWNTGACNDIYPYSWQCAMTHEMGHAVGMLHCTSLCSNAWWQGLPANQQADHIPTMVGADDDQSTADCYCNGFNCGWIYPTTLLSTLTGYDQSAIASLYAGGVVECTAPSVEATLRYDGLVVTIQDQHCYSSYQIWSRRSGEGDWRNHGWFTADAHPGECQILCHSPVVAADDLVRVVASDGVIVGDNISVSGARSVGSCRSRILVTHPNPLNPSTTVSFEVVKAGRCRLDVYNLRGEIVANLVDEWRPAGFGQAVWGGTDMCGREVASGQYLAVLSSETSVDSQKLTVVK